MKIHALFLATIGVIGAVTLAAAQTAPGPADPLADAQGAFGKIVGDAFHAPDPVVAAASTPGSPAPALGVALRESLQAPGAVFAGVMQPFGDADQPVAAAVSPTPQHRRHVHHRRVASRS